MFWFLILVSKISIQRNVERQINIWKCWFWNQVPNIYWSILIIYDIIEIRILWVSQKRPKFLSNSLWRPRNCKTQSVQSISGHPVYLALQIKSLSKLKTFYLSLVFTLKERSSITSKSFPQLGSPPILMCQCYQHRLRALLICWRNNWIEGDLLDDHFCHFSYSQTCFLLTKGNFLRH